VTRPGRLIAIEGNDGTGKSTLCRQLAELLRTRSEPVALTQRYLRPEITRLFLRLVDADLIDQRSVFLLSAADYWAGLDESILAPLADGTTVITDRYVYTHFVHFGSRGVDLDVMQAALDGFRPADAVVLLEASGAVTYERVLGDMKPDMWESGLDHRLGTTIGTAAKRWRSGEVSAAELRTHFLAQQRDMAQRFDLVVPGSKLIRVDASGPIDVEALVVRIDAVAPTSI
jgi:thymidylate kinase